MLPHRTWNFNIDAYLNPFIPPAPWKHLPYPVARFFGYRRGKPKETGNLMPVFWAWIGAFAAMLLIQAVTKRVPSFKAHGAPAIVGSFGASAVLEFYAIEAPLAQPRNIVAGQFLSSLVGVSVAKLFLLSDNFADIQFVGGAIACASAIAIMALTKTVHPPAGATALLAVVDDTLLHLGWWLLPVVLLGCVLILVVALLVNNIERRFPVYWWTPEDLTGKTMFRRRKESDAETAQPNVPQAQSNGTENTAKEEGEEEKKLKITKGQHVGEVVIRRGEVVVPEHMFLTQEEEQLLETMSYRI